MGNLDSPTFESNTEQAEGNTEQPHKVTFVREVTVNYRGPRRSTFKVSEPKAAVQFIRKILPDNSREHFVALYLDGAHNIAAFSVVSTGCANSCPVSLREIFQNAVLVGAVALIVGHNHPSGQTQPSVEDRQVTKRIKEAGVLLGITLLDHVVVCDDSFYSFSEGGEA